MLHCSKSAAGGRSQSYIKAWWRFNLAVMATLVPRTSLQPCDPHSFIGKAGGKDGDNGRFYDLVLCPPVQFLPGEKGQLWVKGHWKKKCKHLSQSWNGTFILFLADEIALKWWRMWLWCLLHLWLATSCTYGFQGRAWPSSPVFTDFLSTPAAGWETWWRVQVMKPPCLWQRPLMCQCLPAAERPHPTGKSQQDFGIHADADVLAHVGGEHYFSLLFIC